MLGKGVAAKAVSCHQCLPLHKLSWAQAAFPCGWPSNRHLWGCFFRRERGDPFYSLISVCYFPCGSHLPRPDRGISGWHLLSLEVHGPEAHACLRDQLRQSSADSRHLFLLFSCLFLAVPWSFLFGGAGEWWEAEERQHRWIFTNVQSKSGCHSMAKALSVLHSNILLWSYLSCSEKTSLVPMACGGDCSWSDMYWLLQSVAWGVCALASPQNTFLCNNILSDTDNFPKYLCREFNSFLTPKLELTPAVSRFGDKENRQNKDWASTII